MRRTLVAIVGATVLLLSVTQGADAATHLVDFDDVVSGCSTSTVFGPPGSRYPGIVFEGGGVIGDACSGFAVSGYSPPNFLGFNAAVGLGGPETMRFERAARLVTMLAGVGRAEGTATLTAYNGSRVVDQDTLTVTFREIFPMTALTVEAPLITHVVLVIDTVSPEFPESQVRDGLAVDDVRWEDASTTPVSKSQCKAGGWRSLTNGQGQPFRSQGQCVSFVAAHRR